MLIFKSCCPNKIGVERSQPPGLGDSGDSLLRQVEEYTRGSVLSSRLDELIIIDDEDETLRVGHAKRRGCGVASTSSVSGMVTDVNPSKIAPQVSMKAFNDAGNDANHFYLIIPTANHRAHNPLAKHMTVYTHSFNFGQTLTFHPLVKALCGLHRISPTQLSLNCWVIMNSMIIL